jgi:hypothetical protein
MKVIYFFLLTLSLSFRITTIKHKNEKKTKNKLSSINHLVKSIKISILISQRRNISSSINDLASSIDKELSVLVHDYKKSVEKDKREFNFQSYFYASEIKYEKLDDLQSFNVENGLLILNDKEIRNGNVIIITYDIIDKRLTQVIYYLNIKELKISVYKDMKLQDQTSLNQILSIKKKSLIFFTYENINENNQYDYKEKKKFECSICISDDPGNNSVISQCGHTFHYDCIKKWLMEETSCPNCRQAIPHTSYFTKFNQKK